jgi:hypothetical protein
MELDPFWKRSAASRLLGLSADDSRGVRNMKAQSPGTAHRWVLVCDEDSICFSTVTVYTCEY